jgi:hypothetical protein
VLSEGERAAVERAARAYAEQHAADVFRQCGELGAAGRTAAAVVIPARFALACGDGALFAGLPVRVDDEVETPIVLARDEL